MCSYRNNKKKAKVAGKIEIFNSKEFHEVRFLLGQKARVLTSCLSLLRRPRNIPLQRKAREPLRC